MSIDFTKQLQTRDGRKVRLLRTDAQEPYPVIILYEDIKEVGIRTSDGKFLVGTNCPDDLMNVPEQVTVDVWINIYDTTTGFSTKKEALEVAASHLHLKRRATLHIKRTVPVGHVDE